MNTLSQQRITVMSLPALMTLNVPIHTKSLVVTLENIDQLARWRARRA